MINTKAILKVNGITFTIPVNISLPPKYKNISLIHPVVLKYDYNVDMCMPVGEQKHLYLKQQVGSDIYKIGCSKDIMRLNRKVETMNTDQFKLLACCPGSGQLESFMHHLYQDKLYGNGGRELFMLTKDDISNIKEIFYVCIWKMIDQKLVLIVPIQLKNLLQKN